MTERNTPKYYLAKDFQINNCKKSGNILVESGNVIDNSPC